MPRKAKDKKAIRPQLRLSETVYQQVVALGPEALSEIVEWAVPRYQGRIDPATLHHSRKTQVLRPSKPKLLAPVKVWYDEKEKLLLAAREERDKTLFAFLVSLKFTHCDHEERFERRITSYMGSPSDRIAETAALLYQAGYPVEVPSSEMASIVIKGQYLREQERWLSLLPDGSFIFRWEFGGDAVYKALGNVHTARWNKALGGSVASRRAYEQIEDFALSWGFAITHEAQEALLLARKEAEHDLVGVEIVLPPKPLPQPAPKPTLTKEVTIPHDLLADDN